MDDLLRLRPVVVYFIEKPKLINSILGYEILLHPSQKLGRVLFTRGIL